MKKVSKIEKLEKPMMAFLLKSGITILLSKEDFMTMLELFKKGEAKELITLEDLTTLEEEIQMQRAFNW